MSANPLHYKPEGDLKRRKSFLLRRGKDVQSFSWPEADAPRRKAEMLAQGWEEVVPNPYVPQNA